MSVNGLVVAATEHGSVDRRRDRRHPTKLFPMASHTCVPGSQLSEESINRRPGGAHRLGTPRPLASSSANKRRNPIGVLIQDPAQLGMGSVMLDGTEETSTGGTVTVLPAPNGRRQFDIGLGGRLSGGWRAQDDSSLFSWLMRSDL